MLAQQAEDKPEGEQVNAEGERRGQLINTPSLRTNGTLTEAHESRWQKDNWDNVDVCETYSPPRAAVEAQRQWLTPGGSFDVTGFDG